MHINPCGRQLNYYCKILPLLIFAIVNSCHNCTDSANLHSCKILSIVGNRADATKVSELVLLLANAKADAIIKGNNIPLSSRHEILLTADQVVVYNNRVLEKPKNVQEARTFIEGYGVLPCSTVGSIVLTDLNTNIRVQGVDTCTIYFDPIDEKVIQQLLDEGKIFENT